MDEDGHAYWGCGLEPFLVSLANKTRRWMRPAYNVGLVGLAIARASSPRRPAQTGSAITNCTTS